MNSHIVISTAGHIDHGKTALIKSLTGTDPDRLKEEKERGMTTDLGFAFYSADVTIIDVPGHEKFIRHMVAGVSTIDLVMLVIAADDGIMPQTIEHFEILKLLDIKKGIIVVTKKDLVEEEDLPVVLDDIKNLVKGSFLEHAPVIAVSNTTNEGIEELKEVLNQQISQTQAKPDRGIFRMPIDRCFTMKGFGTVVAGTILSGKIRIAESVELLPQKKRVKIRGIEVHKKGVAEAGTGVRAALNITGIEKGEIRRGDLLGQIGYFEPANYMNARLELLSTAEKPLKNLERLRIHLGTREILGRVVLLDKKMLAPGDKAIVQFRFESPAVADSGDRFVIRRYSPPITIGGGVIIEPKATKIKGSDKAIIEHLRRIEDRDPLVMIDENLVTNMDRPRKIEEISHDLHLPTNEVQRLIQELLDKGRVLAVDDQRGSYYSRVNFEKLQTKILEILNNYHKENPTHTGIRRTELASAISRSLDNSLLTYTLDKMVQANLVKILSDGKIKKSDFEVLLDKNFDEMVAKIEQLFLAAGFQTPAYDNLLAQKIGPDDLVKKAFRYLVDTSKLVFLGEGIALHQKHVIEAKERLIKFLKERTEIKVSEFRDMIKASRKYALPLLIYFDTKGVTIKRGEVRILGHTQDI